jgi:hypothetical protein
MSRPESKSMIPVTSRVGCSAVAARNEVSSRPMATGAPSRAKWSTPGPAIVAYGGHRRVPRHPEVPGGLGDGVLAGPPAHHALGLKPPPRGSGATWRL